MCGVKDSLCSLYSLTSTKPNPELINTPEDLMTVPPCVRQAVTTSATVSEAVRVGWRDQRFVSVSSSVITETSPFRHDRGTVLL